MALSNFFSKFKTHPQEEEKYFLAVEISPEAVKSALWTVKEKKTKIIKIGSLQEWDGSNKDLLLTAVDASLSKACEEHEAEPQGIIFGLSPTWLEHEEIQMSKKALLKFICEKLELKPLGFVVVLESLVAYLKKEEGTPVNAIFINLLETQSLVSLVELGKIKGTHQVGRSEDLAADVKEGLARFGKVNNLPARMILFNAMADFEEYKQQLISYDWQKELPFLHFPKVEALGINKSIEAVAISGGTEVAKSLGFEIKEKVEEKVEEKVSEVSPVSGSVEPVEKIKDKEELKPEITEKEETKAEEKDFSAHDLGFVENEDIVSFSAQEKIPEPKTEYIHEITQPKEAQERVVRYPSTIQAPNLFRRIFSLPKRIISGLFARGRSLLILIFIPLLILAAILAFSWYVPKAKITIFFTPKVIDKELSLIADASTTQIDEALKVIPAQTKSIEIEEEKTSVVTGEKIIGDKAKGQATIYNKTDLPKLFASGTVLVGPKNLGFALDEDVEIASRSAQEEGLVFGKATVAITATKIGAEANLAGGEALSFQDYPASVYSAKTEGSLSGGTSRQVKVVSQEDINLLTTKIEDSLRSQAQEKFKQELGSDVGFLLVEDKEKVLDKTLSADKGEEAEELKIKLKMEFTAFTYQNSHLKELIAQAIKNDVPSDFVLDFDQAEIAIGKTELNKEKLQIEASLKAKLLPKVDFEEIKNSLVGSNLEETQLSLQKLNNFSRADIAIKPNLPFLTKKLPKVTKNIVIETKLEE